jgi:hypothetical protein
MALWQCGNRSRYVAEALAARLAAREQRLIRRDFEAFRYGMSETRRNIMK